MSDLKKFRLINKVEGYSYLLLLFIAMPLKYLFELPLATKVVGMAHGALFMAFIYQLIKVAKNTPFSKKETSTFFIASLIPFGSFYTDKLCVEKLEELKLSRVKVSLINRL